MPRLSRSRWAALRRWHRLIRRPTDTISESVRDKASVQFRCLGNSRERFVNIDDLTTVVVSTSTDHRCRPAIHVAEFTARRIPWGVRWGGIEQPRSSRNLSLRPRHRARGERFDLNCPRELHHALDLYDVLRCGRRAVSTTDLKLPDLWAGFAPCDGDLIEGDGPELVGRMHESGLTAAELMARHRRVFQRRALYPLAWVSHLWERFDAIYADMSGPSSIQVVQATDLESALTGFRGACEFDFHAGRISQQQSPQPRTPHAAA